MRRLVLCLLLLVVLSQQGWSQQQARVDSLKAALATSADTTRVKVLYELANEFFQKDHRKAVAYAQQGLAKSKQLGWKWGQALGLEQLGRLCWRHGDYNKAQQHILAALAIWRALDEQWRICFSQHLVAELLYDTKQTEKGLEWENRALTSALALRDSVLVAHAYMGLGMLHTQQSGRMNTALTYYQQALACMQHRDKDALLITLLNNTADAHLQLGQAQQALPYLFKAMRLARAQGRGTGVLECTLASVYARLGRRNMAIYHALNAHKYSVATQYLPLLVELNDLLDSLYAQQGNYRLARYYGNQNRQLEAQLRQQEQESKVAELQGRYDTKEKERNIQLLRQQNRIAQLAALQQRTLRNAAFVTAGLLLLAVGILYNRYRLRQRTVQLLNSQKQVLETRDQEKELLLREKTLLLQEVHHRVKNNLQMVLSLLNTQVNTLHEPAAIEAIRDSQSRVQTMALIHQNLYQSESLARIDMNSYFRELTEAIARAFRTEAAAVFLALDIAPLQLNTHTAVPLGLIVNELVTNALKYAFPAGYPSPRVEVRLHQLDAGLFQLVVADNGVGLPASVVPAKVASLGLRLVTGLAQQMKATLDVQVAPSAQFILTFREMPMTAVAART